MVTKKRPWAGMDPVQIITAVTNNTRLKIPKDCDPVLMKQCWRNSPAQRYITSVLLCLPPGKVDRCAGRCVVRPVRPTFDKITEVLSKYHKDLTKIHGVGVEQDKYSDDEEIDGMAVFSAFLSTHRFTDADGEGMDHSEWRSSRIRKEIICFLKQLIVEVRLTSSSDTEQLSYSRIGASQARRGLRVNGGFHR